MSVRIQVLLLAVAVVLASAIPSVIALVKLAAVEDQLRVIATDAGAASTSAAEAADLAGAIDLAAIDVSMTCRVEEKVDFGFLFGSRAPDEDSNSDDDWFDGNDLLVCT